MRLAWVIGRRPAAWTALGAVLFYAALVGAQPSVIRAAIMGGLYVIAIALGRRNTALVAMGIAAAGMTAHDPQIVHDVSFQLSFAATLGLILLTSPLVNAFERLASRSPAIGDFPLTRMFVDVGTMTLAATAFTLPILAINFQQVSLCRTSRQSVRCAGVRCRRRDVRSGSDHGTDPAGRRGLHGLGRLAACGLHDRSHSASSPVCRSPPPK